MNGRRLYRSEREHMLGGVAGGLAEYFDLDPSLVRVAWAVLIIASGRLFLLLYIVMWLWCRRHHLGMRARDHGHPQQ